MRTSSSGPTSRKSGHLSAVATTADTAQPNKKRRSSGGAGAQPRSAGSGSAPRPSGQPLPSAWEQVRLAAGLADRQEDHYRLLLTVGSLLELLIEKGILTREELAQRAGQLDRDALDFASAGLNDPPDA